MSDDKLPQLVLNEWLDSAQPEPAWQSSELDVIHSVSVGSLVGENGGVKTITPNIGDFDSWTNAPASGSSESRRGQ